jgi:hypothetical protein
MMINFGPFAPDRSAFTGAFTTVANNVVPTADGFGPLPDITEISASLPGTPRGSCYVRTSDGTNRIIAATSSRVYELNSAAFTWTDITGPSGPYNLGVDDSWTFTRFGDELIIHNIQDPIQTYNVETGGALADLGGSPPRAKYSWVAGDFLVLGYIDGGASGARSVQWCGINNSTAWTLNQDGADTQELPEGNEVVGGFGEQGGFTVIQRDGMQFFPFALSSGFTFTRQVVNPKQGCAAPRSLVSIGPGQFFYLSEDGFFGGVNRQPIGAQFVDKWFLEEAGGNLSTVQGAADPFRKIVWWRYQTETGAFKRLGYHWQLDKWCTSDIDVGELVALATPSISWDGLDTLYSSINAVDEPFDSRLFMGGRPTMAAFTSTNKLGYFTGPNMASTIETGDQAYDENSRTFISEARIITDTDDCTLADGVSAYHGGPVTWSSSVSPHPRSKACNFRSDGRLHRLRLEHNAGAVWSIASGVSVKAQVTGGV